MAYADQQMSGNRITALVIVALIHVAIGYALISGLAYEGIKAVVKKVTTVDVKEEKKPEPPPPPPKQDTPPPPIVAPPPPVNVNVTPPPIQTVVTPPPPAPPAPPVITAAPPAPPAPPAPKGPATQAQPKGDPGSWVTPEDYPSGPLREGAQGVTGFRVTIDTSGKVSGCEVTSSSGNDQLDKATCQYVTRRARFKPAADPDGHPMNGSYASRVKWVVPKD
jgi:periplasmic protein TonB